MRANTRFGIGREPDEFGFGVSTLDFERERNVGGENSAEKVIGEIGVVLLAIMGFVILANALVAALHLG